MQEERNELKKEQEFKYLENSYPIHIENRTKQSKKFCLEENPKCVASQ